MGRDNYFQSIRGICIIAVVFIHTSDLGFIQLDQSSLACIRQLINFPVATFLFLSGYFFKYEKSDSIATVYSKLFYRIIVPYIVWSSFYLLYSLLFNGFTFNLNSFVLILFFGGASYHLYFLSVLVQLQLLAPVLGNVLIKRSKLANVLVLLITPIYLLIYYGCNIYFGRQIPCYHLLFPAWLIFYYLGMKMRSKSWIENYSIIAIVSILLLALYLSILEGSLILSITHSYSWASSQIKFSSFLFSLSLIVLLLKVKTTVSISFLSKLGDYSFGIYILHIFILNGLFVIWAKYNLALFLGMFSQLICTIITIIICYLFIVLIEKIINKRNVKLIGLR